MLLMPMVRDALRSTTVLRRMVDVRKNARTVDPAQQHAHAILDIILTGMLKHARLSTIVLHLTAAAIKIVSTQRLVPMHAPAMPVILSTEIVKDALPSITAPRTMAVAPKHAPSPAQDLTHVDATQDIH